MHYVDGCLRVCIVVDTLVIELGGYEGFVELAVPEFEEGSRHVRVGTVGRGDPFITAYF